MKATELVGTPARPVQGRPLTCANVAAVVHQLEEHRELAIGRLAQALGLPTSDLRGELEAFNNVEAGGLVLDPLFEIEPATGWPDAGPAPAPTDRDLVRFSHGMGGRSLGLIHQDAAVLGPLLHAAQSLRAMEPDNLDLASATDKLASTMVSHVVGGAVFRAHVAAIFADAAARKVQVRMTYSNVWAPRVGVRVIEPYRVVSTARGYEVDAGPVNDQGRTRTFLLDRVRDFELLDTHFKVPLQVAQAIARNRALVEVTGYAPHSGLWAVRYFSERVRFGADDADGALFTAWVLPPLEARLGVMMLLAGPGAYLDDPDLDGCRCELATQLLAHHDL